MSRAVTAFLIIAIVLAFVFVMGSFLSNGQQAKKETEALTLIPWDLTGFSETDVRVEDDAILLSAGCQQLSLLTTAQQARAVELALQKKIDDRPLTHDLMADSLEFFEVQVVMVKIVAMDSGSYRAKLVMRQDKNVLELDSKPSDAIAVAAKSGAPVYIKNSLLDEQGLEIC